MNVCLDACFLIGLYDERDQHHTRARELFVELFDTSNPNIAVVVWPALYESISTQLVRNRRRVISLERDWRRLIANEQLVFIDDSIYRDDALELCLVELSRSVQSYRSLSLTDRVLRSILEDRNVQVDGILTFNEGDFSDVCRKAGRRIFT